MLPLQALAGGREHRLNQRSTVRPNATPGKRRCGPPSGARPRLRDAGLRPASGYAICRGDSFGLRPNFTPRPFAAFARARVRSLTRLRSNSAGAPVVCHLARPRLFQESTSPRRAGAIPARAAGDLIRRDCGVRRLASVIGIGSGQTLQPLASVRPSGVLALKPSGGTPVPRPL